MILTNIFLLIYIILILLLISIILIFYYLIFLLILIILHILIIEYNKYIKSKILIYNKKNNINSVIIINYLFKDKKHKNKIINKCKYIISIGIPKLLFKLKKYNRTVAIYENISSKTFEQIMSDKNIKEVYIFSHGKIYGVEMSDKFYRYNNLLKIKPIIKKNIICQLHCGGNKKIKPTDISLEKFAKKHKKYKRNMFFFENYFWILFKFNKFYKE